MENYENLDFKYTEVAILMQTTNKYNPGKVPFYLQALTPSKAKTLENQTTSLTQTVSGLANTDVSALGTSDITTGSTITIELPREVTRSFPTKWIPQGTRFLVNFIGGDLTKPVIVGRDYDGYVQHT